MRAWYSETVLAVYEAFHTVRVGVLTWDGIG